MVKRHTVSIWFCSSISYNFCVSALIFHMASLRNVAHLVVAVGPFGALSSGEAEVSRAVPVRHLCLSHLLDHYLVLGQSFLYSQSIA